MHCYVCRLTAATTGTTISGVGAGAVIDLNWVASIQPTGGSYLIQGVTVANSYSTGSGIGAVDIRSPFVKYKNCVISGGSTTHYYGNVSINAQGIILENCYLGSAVGNTLNYGNLYLGPNCTGTITGCTIAIGSISLHGNATLTMTGKNKLNLVSRLWGSQNGYVVIKSDAIVDMSTATGNIKPNASGGITVEDGAKIIPYGSNTAQSLPAGTYTTIDRDGTCTV